MSSRVARCGDGEVECDFRYETDEEVGFTHDPVPSYDRGRTRVPYSHEQEEED